MLTLLFYEPEAETPTGLDALTDACTRVGIVLDGSAADTYRPGRWHDPVTGARAVVDLGQPDLTSDDEDHHPPTTYSGWRALPLSVQIPLAGPHWQAVEALTMVEHLVAGLPGVLALDTEDTRKDDEADSGPYAWSRPRRIAHWEILRTAQDLEVPRLDRGSSLRLWRWRRERAAAALTHPDLRWPEALVVLDRHTGQARTAAILPTEVGVALPPVELLVLQRANGAGCLPSDELLTAAGALATLPAGAHRIEPTPIVTALLHGATVLPASRFAALLDEDWQD